MAVLTDVFIASEVELAATNLLPAGPVKRFPTVQARGIDSVKLATLAALLADHDQAEEGPDVHAFVAGLRSDFPLVRDLGAEAAGEHSRGPWIFRLPDAMAARLAQLSRAEIARYGRTWAATEEWQHEKAVTPSVVTYLRKLCALARRARGVDTHMYLWVAL
jgi:hypothetical protein